MPRVHTAPGRVLTTEDYASSFFEIFHEFEGVIWKLERAQSFDEGSDPSWNAMVRGEWRRSLTLLDEAREAIAADLPARGQLRRLRVVEWPLTPYMQWELHLLALRSRLGERGRVIAAPEVSLFESGAPLPELVIFPGLRMYHVLYDSRGACTGAREITGGAFVEPWTSAVAALYERAEELVGYVERRVRPLAPPRLVPALP
ncbi:hypothetical protein GCM10022226_18030 [Sphaerisporangium flaviroseum]|uniref:DUF6879 domain-containing protein n=1 Tax=Sphaerisporangium flaviroseum TaxID=509199 RepID=A0ABP7HQW9_9ACTN